MVEVALVPVPEPALELVLVPEPVPGLVPDIPLQIMPL